MMNNIKKAQITAIFCIVFITAYLAVPVSAFTWDNEVVDGPDNVGRYGSLALDSTGNPHISYFDDTNLALKYAICDGTHWHHDGTDWVYDGLSWDIVEVERGNVGYDTSLAIDTAGNPHISYYDMTNTALKYAKYYSGSWHIETVDGAGPEVVGFSSSLALDNNNFPSISYYDLTNGNLKYAKFDGVSWSIREIDVEGDSGGHSSLALDPSDNYNPRIVYTLDTDPSPATDCNLRIAKLTSGSWLVDNVFSAGDTGWYPSIAVGRNGALHISYYDHTNGNLRYANFDPDTYWHHEIVDEEGDVGTYTSIALTSDGIPAISYHDSTQTALKCAYRDSGVWQTETVDDAGSVGMYTDIAIGQTGVPQVIYRDYDNRDLKYTTFARAQTTFITIDYLPSTVNVDISESVTISGSLTSAGTVVGSKKVNLFYMPPDSSGWVNIGTTVTLADGTYSFDWVPTELPNGHYMLKASFGGDLEYGPSMAMTTPPHLFLVPEYAFGALAALIACFAGLIVVKKTCK